MQSQKQIGPRVRALRRRPGAVASTRRAHATRRPLASRAVSCAFPGSTEGLRSESCRLRTAAFSPLVAPEIDQGSDEPGFFARCTDRNGRLGLGGSDKRVLHEIERIIGTGRESPGQTIQARVVRVEQGSQSASSVVRRGEWDVGSHRHAVHTLPRRAAPGICWATSRHPAIESVCGWATDDRRRRWAG